MTSPEAPELGLADTSVFIAAESEPTLESNLPEELAVSVITIGELRVGVLLADAIETRHRRLTTLQMTSLLDPLPIDDRVAETWSGLVAELRQRGRRMPINDSWIAATALANDLPVVTRDSDFDSVPGVSVIRL